MNNPPLWAWLVLLPALLQWAVIIVELFQPPAQIVAGKFYELKRGKL